MENLREINSSTKTTKPESWNLTNIKCICELCVRLLCTRCTRSHVRNLFTETSVYIHSNYTACIQALYLLHTMHVHTHLLHWSFRLHFLKNATCLHSIQLTSEKGCARSANCLGLERRSLGFPDVFFSNCDKKLLLAYLVYKINIS